MASNGQAERECKATHKTHGQVGSTLLSLKSGSGLVSHPGTKLPIVLLLRLATSVKAYLCGKKS